VRYARVNDRDAWAEISIAIRDDEMDPTALDLHRMSYDAAQHLQTHPRTVPRISGVSDRGQHGERESDRPLRACGE